MSTTERIDVKSLPRPSRPGALLALDYWLDPERFFEHCDGLGERFVIDVPGLPTWVCTTSPDDIKTIFTKQQASLRMGEAVRRMAPHELLVGGESLIFMDGDEHLHERRKLVGPFHGDQLQRYSDAMVAATERSIEAWPVGQDVRFVDLMQELTLDVIMTVVFGVTDGARRDALRATVLELDEAAASRRFLVTMFVALARKGKWRQDGRIERAVKALDAIVIDEIAARRASGDIERDDFLSMYMQLAADGAELADADIARTMRGLLLGGHETTSMSLAWLVERLIRHPEVLDRLQSDLATGSDAYLDALIAETLRLRPVAPFTARYTVKPFDLGGVDVPAGMLVVPFIALLHRRADIYPDPLEFKPERFLGQRPGTYSWIPFGGGTHRCLGGAFALMEMRVVMRTILANRTFARTVKRSEPVRRRHFAITPGDGAHVTILEHN